MFDLTQQLLGSVRVSPLHRATAEGLQGQHRQRALVVRRILPNFIIIGAAKSATTTLTTILPRHPQIFISRPKEPKFFGRHYAKGWMWYRKLFLPGRGYPLRGEASTMYASALPEFRCAPALMQRYLPDLRIVYVVGHPLDRLVSHWRHLRGRKPDFVAFEDFLSNRHAANLLIGCSSYHARISDYRAHFPEAQIHCMTFEDLLADPADELARLLAFLGAASVAPEQLLDDGSLPAVNKAGEKGRTLVPSPRWPPELRRQVIDRLRPDAEAFLASIGKATDYWRW
ncbi:MULTISPECIES: sulfotransferase domain-containing protein [Aphanothece]|uniref:sulfotransferase domain-containing protein n=1 Tax=Aphanothece TaxID=1121 RepID=UPI00398E7B9C